MFSSKKSTFEFKKTFSILVFLVDQQCWTKSKSIHLTSNKEKSPQPVRCTFRSEQFKPSPRLLDKNKGDPRRRPRTTKDAFFTSETVQNKTQLIFKNKITQISKHIKYLPTSSITLI